MTTTYDLTALVNQVETRLTDVDTETPQAELLMLAKTVDQLKMLAVEGHYDEPQVDDAVPAYHYSEETHVISNSVYNYSVPDYAYKCLVSCGAGGGNGGLTRDTSADTSYGGSSGSGGGSGAYVTEYEIDVTPGGALKIINGKTQIIGSLTVQGGEDGISGVSGENDSGISRPGGKGGVVKDGVFLVPENQAGNTIIYGVRGGASGTYSSEGNNTGENFGAFSGGAVSNSHAPNLGGSGGGGAASYAANGGAGSLSYDATTAAGMGSNAEGYGAGAGGSGSWVNNLTAPFDSIPAVGGNFTDITLKFFIKRPTSTLGEPPAFYRTEEIRVISRSNPDYSVPEYAVKCFVTCGAGGGDGGLTEDDESNMTYGAAAGSGGGSGAYVYEHEIPVIPGSKLNIINGKTQVIEKLTVQGGEDGISGTTSDRTVSHLGGFGGIVLYDSSPVPENLSGGFVIYGANGGNSGTNVSGFNTNGDDVGIYRGGAITNSSHSNYGGCGGGGAASYAANGGAGSTSNYAFQSSGMGSDAEGYGAGAGGSGGHVSNSYLYKTRPAKGGDYTDIKLKFLIERPSNVFESAATHKTIFDKRTITASNAAYPIPANATKAFVTCGAAGGSVTGNSSHYNQSGAGSGAYVQAFEIYVNFGGTLKITKGKTQIIGDLIINCGEDGRTTGSSSSTYDGGKGGTVIMAGFPVPENGGSVIYGREGG